MLPYCQDAKFGRILWSPFAMNELTDKNRSTTRSDFSFAMSMFTATRDSVVSNTITVRAEEMAQNNNATCAQTAIVWEYKKPYVSPPIVGVSRIEQMQDLIRILNVNPTEDVKYLEKSYQPKKKLDQINRGAYIATPSSINRHANKLSLLYISFFITFLFLAV